MLTKSNVIKISFSVLALGLFVFSRLSYADWSIGVGVGDVHHDGDWEHHHHNDGDYRWHDHPHWGYRLHFLPAGYNVVWADGTMYYYYDGLYYIREGFDYELVSPPVGAYVSEIPPDFQAVNINGRIYYTDNGVYYILTEHHGYKVVPQPIVYSQPVQVIETQPQVTTVVTTQLPPAPVVVDAQDSFPVNVPNNSGGYTSVVIKKSGTGYVGPQGEFYASFPSVAQLKAMYGK